MRRGQLLKSLTASEELAFFLGNRANCLKDSGRLTEAQVAYAHACELMPGNPPALLDLLTIIDYQLNQVAVEESQVIGRPADYVTPINFDGQEGFYVWRQRTDRPPEKKSARRSPIDVDELAHSAERASAARRRQMHGGLVPEPQLPMPGEPKQGR